MESLEFSQLYSVSYSLFSCWEYSKNETQSMLLAYNLIGKGFQHSIVRAMSMLLWGSIEESVRAGEVKEGFLEIMSLEGGGRVSQAKSWIGCF